MAPAHGMTAAQWPIVMVVARKTFGYQKKVDDIGLSQIWDFTTSSTKPDFLARFLRWVRENAAAADSGTEQHLTIDTEEKREQPHSKIHLAPRLQQPARRCPISQH
jgi:hypothetical protein